VPWLTSMAVCPRALAVVCGVAGLEQSKIQALGHAMQCRVTTEVRREARRGTDEEEEEDHAC
jgi:hypothetical protein